MKKKFLIFMLLFVSVLGLSACGNTPLNICDYIIEERNTLFVANDDIYNVSLSSGLRETNYDFDGIVNEKTDFAILTFARNNTQPLANDSYAYMVTINEEQVSGFLTKNPTDNTYSSDLEISIPNDATINVKISFTGYTFNQDLTNCFSSFSVDKQTALDIANKELEQELSNLAQDKNVKFEVVMKIMKDHSSVELHNYYWYVGVVSTNGNTLGVLIDANTGDIIAKKV